MKFPRLYDGRILSRYKRFFADVELAGGERVTAHCPNTGAMTGCWEPGAPVQLSAADNPKRKLKWTLERVDMGRGWVGVNTLRVNAVMRHFIESGAIAGLSGYDTVRAEPACPVDGFGRSRLDLLLGGARRADCYVEVKNTTLLASRQVRFPDARTQRGGKHLLMLQHVVAAGHRGVLVFAVNRPEGEEFAVAADIDPEYLETLQTVHRHGVEILAVRIRHTPAGVRFGGLLPIRID